jgi:hypothetical protein
MRLLTDVRLKLLTPFEARLHVVGKRGVEVRRKVNPTCEQPESNLAGDFVADDLR